MSKVKETLDEEQVRDLEQKEIERELEIRFYQSELRRLRSEMKAAEEHYKTTHEVKYLLKSRDCFHRITKAKYALKNELFA